MKNILLIIITTLCLYESFGKQIEYDVNIVYNEVIGDWCPNGKVSQPQPFKSEFEVKEWFKSFRMCQAAYFNEKMDKSVTMNDIYEDVMDDETQTCVYNKNDMTSFDCYSASSISDYLFYVKYLVDFEEIHFNVMEFNQSSFTVYGEMSGVVEIKGIGFGGGLVKNNKFEERYTFKFDEIGNNGIFTRFDVFDDDGLRKKVLRWSKSKAASTLSNSFSSISENIDYLNENNNYFQIDKSIAFLVIVLSILLVILLIICAISQWICCRKPKKRIEAFCDVINDPNSDDEEEENS